MSYEPRLPHANLPPLHRAASARARVAQRIYLANTAIGLFMLIVAAAAGLTAIKLGPADWAGVAALAAFACAISARAYRLITRPDRIWYQGRAIAEEVKSEAWRYAAGGAPYPLGIGADGPGADGAAGEADTLLAHRLGKILADAHHFPFPGPQHPEGQVSQAMRTLRGASFDERKAVYVEERLRHQQTWYAQKAKAYRRIRGAWNGVLLLFEVAGMGAGLAKALGFFSLDLLGFAATVVGAGTSWLQVRQYTELERRYAYAAHQLAILQIHLPSVTPAEWPAFVAQVEDVLEQEHEQWLATRLQEPAR